MADGSARRSPTFRKGRADAPTRYFAYEAAGLAWLDAAAGAAVVEVVDVGPTHLDLRRLVTTAPDAVRARELGRGLARTHDAGASAFGSGPDSWTGDLFFGPLDDPLTLPGGTHPQWGEHYASQRLQPLVAVAAARDRPLDDETTRLLAALCERLRRGELDDDDTPARLHGDLWAGNVLWTPDGAVLIDPAAHGGHRETDLAMLALFGFPYLADVITGYQAVHPLRRGWEGRAGLHQVFPVAVHAILFGGHYQSALTRLLRRWAT